MNTRARRPIRCLSPFNIFRSNQVDQQQQQPPEELGNQNDEDEPANTCARRPIRCLPPFNIFRSNQVYSAAAGSREPIKTDFCLPCTKNTIGPGTVLKDDIQ